MRVTRAHTSLVPARVRPPPHPSWALHEPGQRSAAPDGRAACAQVKQLHVHVTARSQGDPSWPGPCYGAVPVQPHPPFAREALIVRLRKQLEKYAPAPPAPPALRPRLQHSVSHSEGVGAWSVSSQASPRGGGGGGGGGERRAISLPPPLGETRRGGWGSAENASEAAKRSARAAAAAHAAVVAAPASVASWPRERLLPVPAEPPGRRGGGHLRTQPSPPTPPDGRRRRGDALSARGYAHQYLISALIDWGTMSVMIGFRVRARGSSRAPPCACCRAVFTTSD